MQTVSKGQTAATRWQFGKPGPSKLDVHSLWILIGSSPKVGKTTFFAGSPHILIINTDTAVTPPGEFKAAIWPVVDGSGQVGEFNAKSEFQPIKKFSYDNVLTTVTELEKMAERGDPARPKMVVFDTVTSLRQLIMAWLVEKSGKNSFKMLGQDGWRDLTEELISIHLRLKRCGYGLGTVVHVVQDDTIQIDPQSNQPVTVPRIGISLSDGQWRALQPYPDLVVSLNRKKRVNNTTKKAEGYVVLEVDRNVIDRTSSGTRVPLPESIELPTDGLSAWDHFVKIFNESVSASNPKTD